MLRSTLPIAAALLLSACGGNEGPPRQAADTSAHMEDSMLVVPGPDPGAVMPGYDTSNPESFQRLVFNQYARLALQVSPHVTDSILRAMPPDKAQSELNRRMDRQAERARAQLAEKYGVTPDSIGRIVKRGNEKGW